MTSLEEVIPDGMTDYTLEFHPDDGAPAFEITLRLRDEQADRLDWWLSSVGVLVV